MSELVRFSVAIPQELLSQLDQLAARRGLRKNRSELIRDLIRQSIVEDQWTDPDASIIGTLSIVYDHSTPDLQKKLDRILLTAHEKIISSMRIHLDEENCLEVIAMRGRSAEISHLAESLLGVKGVKHGCLTSTTTGGAL